MSKYQKPEGNDRPTVPIPGNDKIVPKDVTMYVPQNELRNKETVPVGYMQKVREGENVMDAVERQPEVVVAQYLRQVLSDVDPECKASVDCLEDVFRTPPELPKSMTLDDACTLARHRIGNK